ncbi:solute carrier family 22 member 1-like [Centruroides vittatus]|uniref:solute carrier family 22 member 1-like n=1 Tax=Centruroides vittatus TaxID=120091 RepID=UPI00350F5B4C
MLMITGVSWFLKHSTYIQLCCSLPSILTLIFISFIPESPRWLLTHGRLRKAEEVIRNIMQKNKRHHDDLTEIIGELYWKIVTNDKRRKFNFFHLFRNRTLRKITFIMYILWFVIIFDLYALVLNADITGGNIFLLFLLFSLLQACVSAVLNIILPRFGRRRILMFGFFSVGITSLLIIAVPNDLLWLRIVFVVLCRSCIAITINIIYGFTLELYPTVVRNVGFGSCSTVSRLGSIAAPFMKDLSEKVNWSIPFVLVGVLTVTSGLCILPLRETKSIPLNDTIVNNASENEEELKKFDKKNEEKLLH